MKPIFKEEKIFLENKLGIEIPNNCWRDGSKIYLNANIDTLLINFSVSEGKMILKKNNILKIIDDKKVLIKCKKKTKKDLNNKEIINKTWQEEIDENNERLDRLIQGSVTRTKKCIIDNPNHQLRISDSGGKDSAVCNYIFQKSMKELNKYDYEVDFFNTTNDTSDTYKIIKKNIMNTVMFQLNGKDVTKEEMESLYNSSYSKWIHNPEMGWYQWLKDVKNYYLPSILVRSCCSTYKEGKLKELLNKNNNYVLFLGMRKYESEKRSHYDWYLNDAMDKMYEKTGKDKYKLNVPRNWIRFLPIVEWTDKDIWLFILREKIEVNPMYYKGFNRVGCLLCPYASDYTDLLIKEYYPLQWKRWNNIVDKNYDLYGVEGRLKWTKQEYGEFGKWKQSTSKINEYITKKPTEERVKIVSELLGTTEEVAKKYFKRKCECGKKLNPDEVAMFLKLYGRYEGLVDERVYLCKKCLCEKLNITSEQYSEKVKEFRNSGCNLF